MKTLYSFFINKEEEVEVQTESVNEQGETVVIKKKEKQRVPHRFFIAKPTRSLADSGNIFNSAKVNEGIKAGLSSIYLIDKKYREDGGVFTDKDNADYSKLIDELLKNTEEYEKLALIPESDHAPEQKSLKDELTKTIGKLKLQIQEFERIKNSLYIHTAEYRARNLLITWWVLHLAYKTEGEKDTPFFGSGSYEDRLRVYDELVEKEDSFISQVIERFMYVISFWVINGPEKQEDFKELDKIIEELKEDKTGDLKEDKPAEPTA